MEKLKMYKHIPSGMFLLLVKLRDSNINTFVDCDELGNVIYKKRDWANSNKLHSQERLIKGFDNLIYIEQVYKNGNRYVLN